MLALPPCRSAAAGGGGRVGLPPLPPLPLLVIFTPMPTLPTTPIATALAERYAIVRELGRGAAATVYLAEDLKHGRQVAIKVLSPDITSGSAPERFLQEIRIAASLVHPQILPLHDSGEAGGFLYYVMPFVEGETLRARLEREGALPLDEAVRITQLVAGALDYAHRRGVVHRDIKPENILLSDGQPVVSDFGVARAIHAAGDHITERGLAVGTPAYMSPEQVTADRAIDGRSDLYGLACVLHEMLAGVPPFTGEDARAVMVQHAVAPPPPLRTVRSNVSPAVEGSVARALAKDPDERFTRVADFARALVASGTGAPLAVRPGREARRIAVLPFENGSADPDGEYFSDGITDELINGLTKVRGLQVTSRTSVFALKGARQDVRVIGAQLGVSAVVEGTVRMIGTRVRVTARLTSVADGAHLWSERYDRDLRDIFAIQDEITRTIVTTLRARLRTELGDPGTCPAPRNVRAYTLYLRGRFAWNKRTPEGMGEAIRYFEEAIAEDPAFALAYTGLSDAYAIQVDYRGVPVAAGMERAKAEAARALALDGSLAEAHASLGWVRFIYDWDWGGAERAFRRAIELDPDYATAHQWYAWVCMAMGREDEAMAEGVAAAELDPTSVSVRRSLGWLCHFAGRYDDAVAHLLRALAMDPDAEETHRILALTYAQQGAYEQAVAQIQEALDLALESTYAKATLGFVRARQGRRDEAERLLQELRALAAERYVSPVALATVAAGLGDADRVFAWLEEAHRERRGWMVYLNVEPILAPFRGDARFSELRRRMGLA